MLTTPLFAATPATIITVVGIFVVLIVALVVIAVFARYFRLWIQSVTTGAGIGILDLIRMTFRKVNPAVVVRTKIMAVQAGLGPETGITSKALEAHYMAGGNVPMVIRAIIAANKAKTIDLDFKLATAIDLAGRNVLEAVQTSVYPKVIDCPPRNSGRPSLDAVAKNGIQLKVNARVTVRANLRQLIGGATEETIIARVGEGIVSAIGSADTHAQVLENPDRISRAVLARKLDSQTAFEIVSIDIADIDVGDNIGARLQADQAEADTRVARARAEGKRAMAVAQEQENISHIEECRAALVAAEAEVPRAIADAFQTGRLGVLEYYKLRNIQADTDMRQSIAGNRPSESKQPVRQEHRAVDDLIKVVILIIGLVAWVISQLSAKNKGGVQPPNQPARRQPPARPKAPPANPDLRKEIEAFLKQATGQQAGQGAPGGRRPVEPSRAGKGAPPDRQRREEMPIEAEVVPEELLERKLAQPRPTDEKQRRRSREFQQRASHLGEDVTAADSKMKEHLQEKFDHQVGRLSGAAARQAALAAETAPAAGSKEGHVDAATMVQWLRDPTNIRRAVIVGEVLQRPEHRW